ncbi:MAG TPA: 3-hydroxyacyl-ACP dehydratase FabZ [Chthonomonadaceae bacterium]|nr:3-hydroxyacyl-ACP dehydratase FabZ [Chthonomonadaceae bacterium]
MDCLLDIEDIRALMPHRYPFLLVDRILELEPGERVVGLKNVTINEPFFPGHFPGQAVMPGVLLIESMAQVAGVVMLSLPTHFGKLAYIAAIDKVKFHKPVVPGDTLITEATILWVKRNFGRAKMHAQVQGKVVAECEMTFSLMPRSTPTLEQVYAKLQIPYPTSNGTGHGSAGGTTDGTPITHQDPDEQTESRGAEGRG